MNPRPPLPEAPHVTPQVDPRRLNGPGRDIYWSAYYSGYVDGIAVQQIRGGFEAGVRDGWAQRCEHERLAWRAMADTISRIAKEPTFDELQKRRAANANAPDTRMSTAAAMASWDAGHQAGVAS